MSPRVFLEVPVILKLLGETEFFTKNQFNKIE